VASFQTRAIWLAIRGKSRMSAVGWISGGSDSNHLEVAGSAWLIGLARRSLREVGEGEVGSLFITYGASPAGCIMTGSERPEFILAERPRAPAPGRPDRKST